MHNHWKLQNLLKLLYDHWRVNLIYLLKRIKDCYIYDKQWHSGSVKKCSCCPCHKTECVDEVLFNFFFHFHCRMFINMVWMSVRQTIGFWHTVSQIRGVICLFKRVCETDSLLGAYFLVGAYCFYGDYVPHRKGGRHIVFGADPAGVGIISSVDISVTLSYVRDISWTGGWILTKYAWM